MQTELDWDANRVGLAFFTHDDYDMNNDITEKMRIDAAGRIGVGIQVPTALFHTKQSSNQYIARFVSDEDNEIAIDQDGGLRINENIRLRVNSNSGVIEHLANTGDMYLRSMDSDDTSGNLVLNDLGGNISIGSNNNYGKVNIENTSNSFSTGASTYYDNLFLARLTTGINTYGASIGFTGGHATRHAAIVSVQTDSDANRVGLAFFTHDDYDMNNDITEKMRIDAAGRIGVGIQVPTALFHTKQSSNQYIARFVSDEDNEIAIDQDGGLRINENIRLRVNSNSGVIEHLANTGDMYLRSMDSDDTSGNLVLNDLGGNVSIGSSSPESDSKLTVAGKITAQDITIKADAGADFVFEKDYALPSLAQVEQYVQENKHLPEIPSAQEMQENGVQVSEMQTKLLQKIEELTLYVIDLQKQVDTQNKRNDQLEVELNKIKSRH